MAAQPEPSPARGLCIALLGAESTGKTTLAAALATRLVQASGLRVAWVPEVLRQWCDEKGRTPRIDEQEGILREQHARIQQAAATHEVVVCDTTAVMTAVYHRIVFGDPSLDALAADLHRRIDLTLLMALDLPWVPDGRQRDGPQVQVPVDDAIRQLLAAHSLGWSLVGGQGPVRLAQAMDAAGAVVPLLRGATAPRGCPGVGRPAV
jgi:nicotinamide riboside kinase